MKRCPVGSTRKNRRCVPNKKSRSTGKRKSSARRSSRARRASRCPAGSRKSASGRCVRSTAPRRKSTYRYSARPKYARTVYAPTYHNQQPYRAPTAFHLKSEGRLRREQPEWYARRDAAEAEAKLRAASAQAKAAIAAPVVRGNPPSFING